MTTITPPLRTTDSPSPDASERVDVIVIGGGQAGLATGYHLARRGLSFVILDAHERVGDAWRRRWDSLTLFTPAKISSLPGMRFPAPPYHYPTKDEVANYLESYAATMELPIRSGTGVQHVQQKGDGEWVVETSTSQLVASSVVIATGGYQTPNIPGWSTDLDREILRVHSMDYRNPTQLQPGPVLVVGASHSGAEIAIEAAQDHPTILAGRDTGQIPLQTNGRLERVITPVIWFAMNHVLTVDTPIGRKAKGQVRAHGFPLEHPNRKDIMAAGVERITLRATGVHDGKPMLEDGRVLDVRNIVWCTGFRGDYSWIEGLSLGEDGYPSQRYGVADGASGLYFVGLKFQRSGASALVGGVGRDAAQVVGHLGARVGTAR